jgi:hypothetical protein
VTTPTRPAAAGKRPDRATLVYTQRCREAFKDVPVVIGGIEASLRRIAHYDYWSDKVRRSILVDSKADLLLYGNAERAIVEIAHRLAQRKPIESITDVRGTAFLRKPDDPALAGWFEIDSTEVDAPGKIDALLNPYLTTEEQAAAEGVACAQAQDATRPAKEPAPQPIRIVRQPLAKTEGRAITTPRERTVIRLPAYEQVKSDPVLYAHASRVLHLETNPGNARAVQRHGEGPALRDVWINPPPLPLTMAEMDHVFDLPYARAAPGLCRRTRQPRRRDQDPGLGDDPLQREHHARLLRRLHLLLHHRARGPHHPEPLGRFDHPRGRGDPRQGQGLHRRHLRPGRPHRQHVPPGLQEPGDRGRLPQAQLRLPRHLPQPQHRPRPADEDLPPRGRSRASRRS